MRFFVCIVVPLRLATVFQEQNSTSFPDTDNICIDLKVDWSLFLSLAAKEGREKSKVREEGSKEAKGTSSS